MKLKDTHSLDDLLAAIRAGVDLEMLAAWVKNLTRPDGDRRLPVPWFRWCREAIKGSSGGVAAKGGHWLDLDDDDLLEPLRSVRGTLMWLNEHNVPLPWIEVALRLAKLARDVSDTAHGGATPEEGTGVTEIAEQLGLAGERAALWDLYCDYRGLSRPALAHCIALPLVDDSSPPQGVLGELRLALMPEGTGQLYRAHTMAFVKIEDDFRDAAATALAALAGMGRTLPENQDLRWEVRRKADGMVPRSLEGHSCGGAFALGMWVLLAGERPDPRTGALGPLRPEDLSGIAITATVDRQGKLGPIWYEVNKLQEAAKERGLPRIHTFVVADGQPGLGLNLDDPHATLCVKRAENVADAERLLVEELRRRGFDRTSILDYHAELQRHTTFVGRDWLFERIEALVKSQPSGYLLLRGDKGFGKSAIFAALVRREAESQGRVGAYHFIHQSGAWDHPLTFFPSLVSQLRRHLTLPPLPEEVQPLARSGDPQHLAVLWQQRFEATLNEVSRHLQHRQGQQVWVLLDALDEAFPDVRPGPDDRDLFNDWLPKSLPTGLFILLSSRRGSHLGSLQRLNPFADWDLGEADRTRNDQDLDDYLRLRDRELGLGLDPAFRARLVEVFAGNFQLAEMSLRVPPHMEGGLEALRRKLEDWRRRPDAIPAQLDEAIVGEWDGLMQAVEKRGIKSGTAVAVLGMLVCIRETLSRVTLAGLLDTLETPSPLPELEPLRPIATLGRTTAAEILKHYETVLDLAWAFLRSDPEAGLGAPQALAFYHASFSDYVAGQVDRKRARSALELLLAWVCVHWSGLEDEGRSYALRYLPHHLREAGQWDALHEMLTDPAGYLPARIALGGEAGWPALMEDYRRTLAGWPRERPELRREIEDVQRALSQKGHRLAGGYEPVIQTLYNLLAGEYAEETQLGRRIREAASTYSKPWLREKTLHPLNRSLISVIGCKSTVVALAWSSQGVLATAHRDGTVHLWDLETTSIVAEFDNETEGMSLVFSPDGNFLALGTESISIAYRRTVWKIIRNNDLIESDGHPVDVDSLRSLPIDSIRLWSIEARDIVWSRQGHPGCVVDCLAFSSDGALLASGGRDRAVRIWRVQNGDLLTVLECQDWPRLLVFSPDDLFLYVCIERGAIHRWDRNTGDWRELISPARVSIYFAVSSNCEYMAQADKDNYHAYNINVKLFTINNGNLISHINGPGASIANISFSPDGTLIAIGYKSGEIRLASTRVGVILADLTGHSSLITCLSFSPDSQWLASGSTDRTIRLWKTKDGTLVDILGVHTGTVTHLAFSPDGGQLASCCGFEIWLWNTSSRQTRTNQNRKWPAVTSIKFIAYGKKLAAKHTDGMIRVWNVQQAGTNSPLQTLRKDLGEFSVFSDDGKYFACVHSHYLDIRPLARNRILQSLLQNWGLNERITLKGRNQSSAQAWESTGYKGQKTLNSGEQNAYRFIFQQVRGALDWLRPTLKQHEEIYFQPESVIFSSSTKYVAVGAYGHDAEYNNVNAVFLIRRRDGQVFFLAQYKSKVNCLAFDQDEQKLASGGDDGVRLWSLSDLHELYNELGSKVSSLCFTPDGELITGRNLIELRSSGDGSWIWGRGEDGEIMLHHIESDGNSNLVARWVGPHVQALYPKDKHPLVAQVAWVDLGGSPCVSELELAGWSGGN